MKMLDDIQLPGNERAAIAEATKLLRENYPIKSIILFGSKSRGDDDPESDIDLLLLTTRTMTRAECHAISDDLFPIQLKYDVVLSTLIVYSDEWISGLISVLPIRDEVEEQGVIA
jgi:predicted nucleotidyltransferase